MKLSHTFSVPFILILLCCCKKEGKEDILPSDSIVEKVFAGEANLQNIKNLNFNESLNIPQDFNTYKISLFWQTPHQIDLNGDETTDFGVCSEWGVGLYNAHYKAFRMNADLMFANSEYEFAVLREDTISYYKSNVSIVQPLNKNEIIDEDLRWLSHKDSQLYLTFWCDVDEDGIIREDINTEKLQIFKENVDNKFIGIRKKVGEQYKYGWINYSVYNCEKLILGECFFEL